jgi:hypothetical protein
MYAHELQWQLAARLRACPQFLNFRWVCLSLCKRTACPVGSPANLQANLSCFFEIFLVVFVAWAATGAVS